jgi:hypothetical protein
VLRELRRGDRVAVTVLHEQQTHTITGCRVKRINGAHAHIDAPAPDLPRPHPLVSQQYNFSRLDRGSTVIITGPTGTLSAVIDAGYGTRISVCNIAELYRAP